MPSIRRPLARTLAPLPLTLALAGLASGQIGWASFHEDPSRLVAGADLGADDDEEKDYAWGDLDKDGWTDLVVVRKQPFTTSGRRVNVLFMNESGVLVDRTADYATAADVAGDSGFQTPTNDRDVVVTDVDGDGWLDVVTSTTISPGQPKRISHPRVYVNLQEDGGGNWLGLRYEESRTPNLGTFPNFCGIAAGDVTGDDRPDLFFAHYEQAADVDLDDRLWINDGSGSFSDQSAQRMTQTMREVSFGTAAAIVDVNGDGVNDVVKNSALGSTGGTGPSVSVIYNDPGDEGFFNIFQTAYEGAPYHVNIGDLNRDGKTDLVIADDGPDRYLINGGNDGLGRVDWSPAYTYQVNDDGFASNNLIANLDDDDWDDVLIADVDVDIPGCDRRMHIYHNKGGAIGGNVTLEEESGGGSKGVSGMSSSDLSGTHDVAVFDLDNDGDLDMILGRCDGTNVWINDLYDGGGAVTYCNPGDGNPNNVATIDVSGTDLSGPDITVDAANVPANSNGYLIVGASNGAVPNPPGAKGTLCVTGGCQGRYGTDVQSSGAGGTYSTDIKSPQTACGMMGSGDYCLPGGCGPSNIQAGETWYFQYWHRQPMMAPASFSEAIRVTFE